jgi:adenylate cyclase
VKLKPFKRVPALIAFGVILLVGAVRWAQFDFLETVERMTYDMRVREANRFDPTVATNLGFVSIDDASIDYVRTNLSLGFHFGLYWPRQIYGRVIQELAAQGAKAVAMDVIFADIRDDHPPVRMADGSTMESDVFFALQMKRAGNTILAVTDDLTLPALFATNAMALGHIFTDLDSDGKLRRACAFRAFRKWHPAFRQVEADPTMGVDLKKVIVGPNQIVLRRPAPLDPIAVPLDAQGNFDLVDFGGTGKAKPFTEERMWHMGIVLAAQALKLDLEHAEVDLPHGRITLHGPGIERELPVDKDGFFFIDWCMPPNHPALHPASVQQILEQSLARLHGQTNEITDQWQGELVVFGSGAVQGNDLMDHGATPLLNNTQLVSKHWNVANSILTGRFVHRSPLEVDLALIVLLGIIAAVFTWEFRVLTSSAMVIGLILSYVILCVVMYIKTRYWLPLVMPVVGAMAVMYVSLMAWRVVVEQAEWRRIRSMFSMIVSPKIVNELLASEIPPSLGGARRQITVLFADVRGFTELTDTSQERVAEYVQLNKLSGAEAEACFDEQARETLLTVNAYLGLVADTLIRHDGTLDKFIGDCVMAFWGAPTSNPKHAQACVQAAIAAQRAIYDLNLSRAEENKRREIENLARSSAGMPPKPLLPLLLLGSGINTGMATVGLMGSQQEQQNYTVFGREINLASRLESASGRGRIFIGETTYQHLLRDDPILAATCVELPLKELKGFRSAVKAYEVPWQRPDQQSTAAVQVVGSAETSFTSFSQRG